MTIIRKLKKVLFILTLSLTVPVAAQNLIIDYLGIISTSLDQNMAKMTGDLYFTQLNEISDITVIDKRAASFLEIKPEASSLSATNISFYTEIKKSETAESWTATFYVINPNTNEIHSKSKDYDSFYKILMESKNNLKSTIEKLLNNTPSENEDSTFNSKIASKVNITSTENLSGTWSGEEFIDKIVILRGGRGFVIFNNGASMNITIKLEASNDNQNIIITQNGRSNASFYPDLPRSVALNAALEADPIEWRLTFTDDNTLIGQKKTIIVKNDNYDYETVKVKWNRIN